MAMRVLVATAGGLLGFDGDGGEPARELEGRSVGALAPAGWQRLWAVVGGAEIWRREGEGGGWQQIASLERLEATCLADTRANHEAGISIGTSEARLARLTEKGELEWIEAFDQAPGRDRWFTPWGGPPAVRTLSEDHNTVYVNVHVGGVLRSLDEGARWEPTIDIEADVHQVATGHGHVYAAGARGLAVSADRGESWRTSSDGLHAAYCRAVAVCGRHLLLSASDGPGRGRAAVYRSEIDGRRFEKCDGGLPEWFAGNVESLCLDALPDGRLAAFGSEAGELYASSDEGASWRLLAAGLSEIRRVLVLP